MAANEQKEGRSAAFFYGFLLGVLVCVAVGAPYFLYTQSRVNQEMMQARDQAYMAREFQSRFASQIAEEERRRSEAGANAPQGWEKLAKLPTVEP